MTDFEVLTGLPDDYDWADPRRDRLRAAAWPLPSLPRTSPTTPRAPVPTGPTRT